jgi:hypothetical protein
MEEAVRKVLSEAQVASYRRDGIVFPIDLLSRAEAVALRRKVEAVETRIGAEMQSRFKIKAHLPFPWLWDIIAHPMLLDAVEDLIGPDILCWGSSFFTKNAHDPRFVSWHQDSTYYGLEPPDTLTAWLAISDSTVESGCVRFLPGSHDQGVRHHDEYPEEGNLLSRGQTIAGVDADMAVDVELKAGQFSFHKEDVIHGSNPNRSDGRRLGFSIHYVAPHVHEVNYPEATAALLRGENRLGHWGADPVAKEDWDPECLDFLNRSWERYKAAQQTA